MSVTDHKKTGPKKGPLVGVRVFDMTRILAGPSATQILGDMGAEILKIERPNVGDDTRTWGPPFVQDDQGQDTTESSYYLCANRNKKSITLDVSKPEGVTLAKKIIGTCDIFFENFKTGSLDKYGLSYDDLKKEFPSLIYCSLTGFGHTGPLKDHAGYDFLIQGMGGIMSLTGPADGEPSKIGVAQTDLITGLYALSAILAALYHREKTGEGQHIDVSLLDCHVATLSNAGQYYLSTKTNMPRMGNAHSTIVPYQSFETSDGHMIVAVGNDKQFKDLCTVIGKTEIADDTRFTKNKDRVKNRNILIPILSEIFKQKTMQEWLDILEEKNIPSGPVNTLNQVFSHPQVLARNMITTMAHPLSSTPVDLIANPIQYSKTPVSYDLPPPTLGQDTDDVLKDLGLDDQEIKDLHDKNIV